MKKSRMRVVASLVLLIGSSAAIADQVPRCWVINCRGAYGEKCVRCLMANCGNRLGVDPTARSWCFTRPHMTWPNGTPGTEQQ